MEEKHIKRLREEQQNAIAQTAEKLELLNKFKQDYENLQVRLKTLPDKVTHNVMVPFGKKAFMPGQLVHTNEILVLLGDNWFAERSAKQASEIIDRRKTVLDKQISEMEQQLGLLQPRLEFTSELQGLAERKGDVVEITEEYDAEKEKIWRERHKENVRKYNRQLREEQKEAIIRSEIEEKEKEEQQEREAQQNEAELWARLDELEKQEGDKGELDIHSSESSEDESDDSWSSRDSESEDGYRKVKWKDEPKAGRTSNVIRFTHTSQQQQTGAGDAASASSETVMSPGDIYKKFAPYAPKSILKQSAHVPEPQQGLVKDKTILPDGETAFSGTVVEKSTQDLDSPEMLVPLQPRTQTDETDAPAAVPKKVSKFKAQRMQSKR